MNTNLLSKNELVATPTARQAEILERVAELVAESGLANLTLKRVADRVGFTEAAIYRHFPNKQALVFALIDQLGSRLLGPIAALAAAADQPPRERLLAMVRHHVHVLRSTGGLPILLVAEGLASGNQALVGRLGSVMRAYLGRLAAVLGELALPLALPPERQAAMFLGLPAALGMQLRAVPDLAPSDEEVDALVRFYVGALTAAAPLEEKR